MRAGGRGILALVLAAAAVVGAVAAERIGPATRASGGAVPAASGIWLCPHGGGKDWSATIAIANPGTSAVDARLTPIGPTGPGAALSVAVPPGREVLQPMPATQRASATYVESFGGWVGVGWQVAAGGSEAGLGTEACMPAAATSWYTADADTTKGRQAFLVLMNPFAQDAVYDVTLYQPGRPPARPEDWNGAVLPAGRSVALELDQQVLGRDPVGAQVDVSKGKVAVASLGVRASGGVASVLGATGLSSSWYLPVAAGVGQSSLAMLVPADDGALFSGTVLSSQEPQAAGTLTEVQQSGRSTGSYEVLTSGASAIQVTTQDEVPILAALRATGRSLDDAATGGVATPAEDWLVPPTVRGTPAKPGLVLVNPGTDPVDVTLRLLPEGATDPGEPVTLTIPGQRAVGAPAGFLARDPLAAVLVRATGSVVALGASTSGGKDGLTLYGLAAGVPVPAVALPAD